MPDYRYSIEVGLMESDTEAYKEGNRYSYFFNKHFGDMSGVGGPAKDRAEVMSYWWSTLKSWREYDSILGRMPDPVTMQNTNFRTNTVEFSKGDFFGMESLTQFPTMTKEEEEKAKPEGLPEHPEKNVIYTMEEVKKRIEQGLPFKMWWGGEQRHVALERHNPTGKIIALGFKQQHFPEPYEEAVPPPIPRDRMTAVASHYENVTEEELQAYHKYWSEWERIDPWVKVGTQPGLRHKRGIGAKEEKEVIKPKPPEKKKKEGLEKWFGVGVLAAGITLTSAVYIIANRKRETV